MVSTSTEARYSNEYTNYAEDNGDHRSPNRHVPSPIAQAIYTATHRLRVCIISLLCFPNALKRSPWHDTTSFSTDWRCLRCCPCFGHTLPMKVYSPNVLGADCSTWIVGVVAVTISARNRILCCVLAWSRGQSWSSRHVLSCDGGDVVSRQR